MPAVSVSRTTPPQASLSAFIRRDTGRESQFTPSMSSAPNDTFFVFRKLFRIFSRPAVTRRLKSGNAGFRASMSTLCARICRASMSALRVRAGTSESTGPGETNASDRSPDASLARVAVVSELNDRLVGRMRSVRCRVLTSMLSRAIRAV